MLKWAYLLLVIAATTLGSRMIADLAAPATTVDPATEVASAGRPVASDDHGPGNIPAAAAQRSSSDTRTENSASNLLDPDIARRLAELRQQRQQAETADDPANNLVDHSTQPAQTNDSTGRTVPAAPIGGLRSTEKPSTPIRQQSPSHPQMLTPGNFEYLGAFRPPLTDKHGARFTYGGVGVTFRADGDPDGDDDGFPGSLFVVGHRHDQKVAEISIPRPVISPSKNIDELPISKVLQPLSDVTGGIRGRLSGQSSEPFEIGGLQVIHDRLHWTVFKYYNVNAVDYFSHGASSLNLADPKPRGLWHLGPANSGDPRWHSYKHAGYICEVPEPFAARHLGGRNLMSGLQISTGRQTSSQGPALFSYNLPQQLPRNGASLNALPLLWYPMNRMVPNHHAADLWRGAAWLTLGDRQAIVFVGRKALGPERYGDALPTDCYNYKGYHGSEYEVQMLFYAPGNLVSAGHQAVPAVRPWYRWNRSTPGGGIDRFMYQNCGREVGGLAYDRRHQLLYLTEMEAGRSAENEWEDLPIIHTFRLVD